MDHPQFAPIDKPYLKLWQEAMSEDKRAEELRVDKKGSGKTGSYGSVETTKGKRNPKRNYPKSPGKREGRV